MFHEMYPALTEWQREIVADTIARGYDVPVGLRFAIHHNSKICYKYTLYPLTTNDDQKPDPRRRTHAPSP